jgi:hypothetical protein
MEEQKVIKRKRTRIDIGLSKAAAANRREKVNQDTPAYKAYLRNLHGKKKETKQGHGTRTSGFGMPVISEKRTKEKQFMAVNGISTRKKLRKYRKKITKAKMKTGVS